MVEPEIGQHQALGRLIRGKDRNERVSQGRVQPREWPSSFEGSYVQRACPYNVLRNAESIRVERRHEESGCVIDFFTKPFVGDGSENLHYPWIVAFNECLYGICRRCGFRIGPGVLSPDFYACRRAEGARTASSSSGSPSESRIACLESGFVRVADFT